MSEHSRRFSLLDLVIAVAIITFVGQLAAMGIEASRALSRGEQCQDNLRHLALACQKHVDTFGRFPCGGWGYSWAGDPDRGNDSAQPGGWVYNLLPFLGQERLHRFGERESDAKKRDAVTTVCRTALPTFYCPTRRPTGLYPFLEFDEHGMYNTNFMETCAKSDYAANAGDTYFGGPNGPLSIAQAEAGEYEWYDRASITGVIFQRSEVTVADVSDGLSHTYLFGEKLLNPDHYEDGDGGGDDQCMYGGYDQNVVRFTGRDGSPLALKPDTPNKEDLNCFGGPHGSGCNFVFADGAVRAISFSVDPVVHRQAGNRRDKLPPVSVNE